jgi:hypothetical protein
MDCVVEGRSWQFARVFRRLDEHPPKATGKRPASHRPRYALAFTSGLQFQQRQRKRAFNTWQGTCGVCDSWQAEHAEYAMRCLQLVLFNHPTKSCCIDLNR